MNKLPMPQYDDSLAFDCLANNARLGSFPHLTPLVTTVKSSYAQYVAAKAVPSLIHNPMLTTGLSKLLKGHYSSPPADLAFISDMRETTDHLVCPMCGSMHSGTLDHYLPKTEYPIFSIFSKNLIPACKCNSKRGETLLGPCPGERVLHPYFDECLGDRLIKAQFDDLGAVPKVSIVLTISNTHPQYKAIDFHVRSIVAKSAICRYLANRWSKLYRKPSLVVRAFAENRVTPHEVQAALEEERHSLDDLHGGPNNWNSIFVSGLLEPVVADWLASKFSIVGRVPDGALG